MIWAKEDMQDDETKLKLEENLYRLKQSYLKRISSQIGELRRLQELLKNDFLPQSDIQQLFRSSHNFAGSGATYGFPQISNDARVVHEVIKEYMAANKNSPAPTRSDIIEKLRAFEQSCREALEQHKTTDFLKSTTQSSYPATQINSHGEKTKNIYIFSKDFKQSQKSAEQLSYFSYKVSIKSDAQSFLKELASSIPDCLLFYTNLNAQDINLIHEIKDKIKEIGGDPKKIPIIIISSQGDYSTRLAAVRLEIDGFFTDQADILSIVDKIRNLDKARQTQKSYNILIVDDDEMLTEFYTHTLKSSGMRVTALNSPKDCLKAIADQSFDLILIDYFMPHCNGQELAAIIRQHENYLSLPIVFISAKEDLEMVLRDSHLGIDEFLLKPFKPQQLLSVICNRAERSAELRSLTIRDSFTGLFNHAHFIETLTKKTLQAKRGTFTGTYALIDLDHFKSINDTYGHPAGDIVIKNFARLLQQNLRESDIMGRCGGEEFGIILPDCDLERARSVLDAIREKFCNLSFNIDGEIIQSSFSAGLTEIGNSKGDVKLTLSAADKALYTAKKNGRNQIEAS